MQGKSYRAHPEVDRRFDRHSSVAWVCDSTAVPPVPKTVKQPAHHSAVVWRYRGATDN
jgi:hypothetical protein